MEELWKPCAEFEDHYEVSNLGNVRSKAVFIPHDGNWNESLGGYIKHVKLHNQQKNRYGYMHVKLCKYGVCKHRTVHRLVAKAFLPNPLNYRQVNHIDGDKENNNVTNLEWCSNSQNIKHAWDTGLIDRTKVSGENHHNSKLKAEQVVEIRNLFSTHTVNEIAELFNVSKHTIADIRKGRSWKIQ